MRDLVEFLVRALVADPDAVRVDELEEDDGIVLEVRVADDDLGRVIGREGRVANAIRTIAKAAATAEDAAGSWSRSSRTTDRVRHRRLHAVPGVVRVVRGQRHVRNARRAGLRAAAFNYRDTTPLTGGQVDDSPYGGGAGMVLRVDVVDAALRRRLRRRASAGAR